MQTETPQDREDRIIQRLLAIATVALVAFVTVMLMFKDIPSKNEVMVGTVVGFIFGNMAGPVYRKIFGGPDAGTRQAVSAQNDVLKSAVAAASGTGSGTTITVPQPNTVEVKTPESQDEPDRTAKPPEGN